MAVFSRGLKNEFETAVANELSVFEPLRFTVDEKMEFAISLSEMLRRHSAMFLSLLQGSQLVQVSFLCFHRKDMLPKKSKLIS